MLIVVDVTPGPTSGPELSATTLPPELDEPAVPADGTPPGPTPGAAPMAPGAVPLGWPPAAAALGGPPRPPAAPAPLPFAVERDACTVDPQAAASIDRPAAATSCDRRML